MTQKIETRMDRAPINLAEVSGPAITRGLRGVISLGLTAASLIPGFNVSCSIGRGGGDHDDSHGGYHDGGNGVYWGGYDLYPNSHDIACWNQPPQYVDHFQDEYPTADCP